MPCMHKKKESMRYEYIWKYSIIWGKRQETRHFQALSQVACAFLAENGRIFCQYLETYNYE